MQKDYIWNLALCTYEKGKYLESIIDDSMISCDETIEATKTFPTKSVSIKSTSTNFYILLNFLLFTIELLILGRIYCYLINCELKKTFITISRRK